VAAAAAACLTALTGCGRGADQQVSAGRAASSPVGQIDVDDQTCAADWQPPTSGPTTFTITNHGTKVVEVELTGVPDRRVYARIEVLPPGVARPANAVLSAGSYQWKCVGSDSTVHTSAAAKVTGSATGGRSYAPVGQDELLLAMITFRSTTADGLAHLATDAHALRSAADGSASTTSLRLLWVVARQDYERLGGAYGLFGGYDAKINGRPDGLAGGTSDSRWTGFGRLEYALWHAQSRTTVRTVADQLDKDVAALKKAFPIEDGDSNSLTIRAHEILENALQFELNGEADQGSHTNLANLDANLDGARTTLDAVAPLLKSRDPQLLALARSDLDAIDARIAQFHTSSGWTPVRSIPRAQRAPINALVSKTVEDLAAIPATLHIDKNADE
jgi:high-affinity iron transporter